jgi:uncharacterized protein with HEPN domain
MTRHDEGARLRHMLDAAREAVGFARGKTRADLHADRGLQLILTRLLEIVGEAASRIPQEWRDQYPAIPWSAAVAIRNRLIHGYEDVDLDIVWQTVEEDLPRLIASLEKAIDSEPA